MLDKQLNPDFLNDFLNYSIVILNKSENTVKEYNYDLNSFLKFIKIHFNLTNEEDFSKIMINDLELSDLKKIKLEDLHSYLAYITKKNKLQPATRARKVASLKSFFNYLTAKTNKLKINPAQNLETPKIGKRIPKYLTFEESKNLLNVSRSEVDRNNERDFAIITIFLNCGMRLSELVNISMKDIKFDTKALTVIGKGNKERTIYLNTACMNAIEDYIKVRPKDGVKFNSKDALFLSERKERISNRTVQCIVKKELQRAGLDTTKYSVHKLRHTAATLMYKYGHVDIRALQELLGHSSISTTEIYTHVDNEQVRSAVEMNPLADL